MLPSAHVDWQTVANVSTAVGVVIALAGVILTLILTLRSQKLTRDGQALDRQQAEASAARSEAAATLTEEYTRRVVEALETMAQGGAISNGDVSTRQGVRWSLSHYGGSTYLLRNDGDTTAKDVHVMAHETMHFILPEGTPDTLEPGEGLTFMASMTLGTRDRTITVDWTENDAADVKTWRYPLPPGS